MNALEIKAVRALRGKIFANMAVLESFCGHMRRVLAASHDVETGSVSDRELAQMVQQWLSVGDNSASARPGDATSEDIDASFAVLEATCERLLGPDFTLEERQALTSLSHYLKRRTSINDETAPVRPAAQPASAQTTASHAAGAEQEVVSPAQGKQSFMARFWHALNSA